MKLFKRRRAITCQQAVGLVTDYLDDALPASERRSLEGHLRQCPHCSEYLAQIRATIAATGHVDTDEMSPQMQQTLIELYRSTTRQSS